MGFILGWTMTEAGSSSVAWSWARRAGARFAFSFFLLSSLPMAVGYLPGMGWINRLWMNLWKPLVIWIGAHALRLSQPVIYQRTGSGDTAHDWIFMLLVLAWSLVSAVVWLWLDREGRHDAVSSAWLRVYLRYTLGSTMLVYGVMKVFDQQFFPPHGLALTQALGQTTPMRLAWNYVGYSIPYTVFAGALECLGGLLLFFRRTTTLGAAVSAIVLTNVVMMNICYDIPVKLHSALYLVMAFAILAPSARRLVDVFLFHKPVEPEAMETLAGRGWMRWTRMSLKALVLGGLLVSQIGWGWNAWLHRAPEPGPLNGLYEIESLRIDGADRPPVFTDKARWRWMEIGATYVRIATVDGHATPGGKAAFDPSAGRLSIQPGRAPRAWEIPTPSGSLTVKVVDASHLHLSGTLDGRAVDLTARRTDPAEFPLITHRIHWVSELPDNH